MTEKRFKAVFMAHVPDSDPTKHRSVIKTSLYELTSILVKDDDEAIKLCRELVQKEGVHAFLLCPGFTHKTIAKIVDAVGEDISVNVARGDIHSNKAAFKIMNEVGWFSKNR